MSVACSAAWQRQPASGSATPAGFWVALEQPGPWGRDALVESHLDPALGRALGDEASAAGGRVLLIRAAGHHAAGDGFQSRRVFVAGGLATGPFLLEGVALGPDAVLRLPWEDLAAGDADAVLRACPWLRAASHPVLLVCTNSRRDVCCALQGRPIVQAAAARHPGQVWEWSHTGGHRFAPTGLVLPIARYASFTSVNSSPIAASTFLTICSALRGTAEQRVLVIRCASAIACKDAPASFASTTLGRGSLCRPCLTSINTL